jgi:hypothetical protein
VRPRAERSNGWVHVACSQASSRARCRQEPVTGWWQWMHQTTAGRLRRQSGQVTAGQFETRRSRRRAWPQTVDRTMCAGELSTIGYTEHATSVGARGRWVGRAVGALDDGEGLVLPEASAVGGGLIAVVLHQEDEVLAGRQHLGPAHPLFFARVDVGRNLAHFELLRTNARFDDDERRIGRDPPIEKVGIVPHAVRIEAYRDLADFTWMDNERAFDEVRGGGV